MDRRAAFAAFGLTLLSAACERAEEGKIVLTFPASAVGMEAELLSRQLERFMEEHPDIRVVQRPTPDAADQRHQLYVQWLNARAPDPDILQLDVIWAAEFAAAGWILPLDRFGPPADSFFPQTVRADTWNGRLYALPWFVDVGMLYRRVDLVPEPPPTLDRLIDVALHLAESKAVSYGMVFQGARYEGLVTVFLEFLTAFGGQILDDSGRVVVDSEPAVRALAAMKETIESGAAPRAVLTWQEEPVRFAFQNGEAAFMRNWPYAAPLLGDTGVSRVARRFAVSLFPRAVPEGRPAAALGGSQLAINARTEHPEAAYALIRYLTADRQMLERAEVLGQFPARPALYGDPRLAAALAVDPAEALQIVRHAVPRPVTPLYTELSQILQASLHRSLSGQQEPARALAEAAAEMRRVLVRAGLYAAESIHRPQAHDRL
ncbi:MAG: putative ABC transporter-binding protein [Gemmatimonadales bacterium]|nr:putative ABC transporter-binding protein [bacterium HR33]GIW52264.1 MAG: putative ABC transporter-binding protein [Gemmatimonadales bacterium]